MSKAINTVILNVFRKKYTSILYDPICNSTVEQDVICAIKSISNFI